MSQPELDRVTAELKDTQHSLAAALARIEVYRQREKLLRAEIAQLRCAGSGSSNAPNTNADGDQHAHGAAPAEPATPPARLAYVTEVDEHVPVLLVSSSEGRKVPGGVVVTPGFIDFVEVRARVKREQFVGFAAAGNGGAGGSSSSRLQHAASAAAAVGADSGGGGIGGRVSFEAPLWQSLLPACLSPSTANVAPDDDDEEHAPPPLSLASWGEHGSRSDAGRASFDRTDGGGGSGGNGGGAPFTSSGKAGPWQVIWRSGRQQRTLCFEATRAARELLHWHTAAWRSSSEEGGSGGGGGGDASPTTLGQHGGGGGGEVELVAPRLLGGGGGSGSFASPPPALSEPSALLDARMLAALAAALPARLRAGAWALVYSTARHGTSLATLYRRAAGAGRSGGGGGGGSGISNSIGCAAGRSASSVAAPPPPPGPTVLAVRDAAGHVFGAFAPDQWRPQPRFFGSGEAFVFACLPHMLWWPWHAQARARNAYFQYAAPDCLAVGGHGRFALWLDGELLRGSSGPCGAFGSPCLAHSEDFAVAAVELWRVGLAG